MYFFIPHSNTINLSRDNRGRNRIIGFCHLGDLAMFRHKNLSSVHVVYISVYPQDIAANFAPNEMAHEEKKVKIPHQGL